MSLGTVFQDQGTFDIPPNTFGLAQSATHVFTVAPIPVSPSGVRCQVTSIDKATGAQVSQAVFAENLNTNPIFYYGAALATAGSYTVVLALSASLTAYRGYGFYVNAGGIVTPGPSVFPSTFYSTYAARAITNHPGFPDRYYIGGFLGNTPTPDGFIGSLSLQSGNGQIGFSGGQISFVSTCSPQVISSALTPYSRALPLRMRGSLLSHHQLRDLQAFFMLLDLLPLSLDH